MKKLLLLGSLGLSLTLFGCVQYEDGEPVENTEEDTSTAANPAGESETNESSASEETGDEVGEIEEDSEVSFEDEITAVVNETIGEDKVTDLVALSDGAESTMSVTFESDKFSHGPAGKDRIDMEIAETLIKLKELEAPPFYDITFLATLDDNTIYRANYNQDALDNYVTDDPHEFRLRLQEMSIGYYLDPMLEG